MLVAITGVSGSGKSTLVHQVLYRAVARALGQSDGADPSGVFTSLTGVERLNDVVLVDQTPIGRTPRSNPITYIKGFDLVRELFASQPEAKRLSLTPATSPSTCPAAAATPARRRHGHRRDAVPRRRRTPCEECNGTRYQARILDVRYKGKNIHDVLQMTVKEPCASSPVKPSCLKSWPCWTKSVSAICALANPPPRSQARSAARQTRRSSLQVRAVNATAKPSQASRVLYILDEPTTGLHFDDVSKLLTAFRKLIDGGGSLIVIEHNLDVIKSADWVIDLVRGRGRRRPHRRRRPS